MNRSLLPFLVALIAGLALLAGITDVVVVSTTRSWFERDIAAQAHLAVRGAERTLMRMWREGRVKDMTILLEDITQDSRVLAAYVCGSSGAMVAATSAVPAGLACDELLKAADRAAPTTNPVSVPGGGVHLTYWPFADHRGLAGIVVVHDTAFIQRREAESRRFLLAAFALLAVAAALLTLVASRLSWRGWNREIVRLLRGGPTRAAFQPVLRDVRELVERLSTERDVDGGSSGWTPQRLRSVLTQHLQGERIVVLANREPYIHHKNDDGSVAVLHPASGLVTALEPVLRACSGVWVAHGGGSADRETADRHSRLGVPPGQPLYTLRRVWLNRVEEQGYYYGFANEGLWALCHLAHTRPIFRSEDWTQFEAVNRKFADAACEEVESDDPIILVQDYHLALAPRMIRERLPRATILTFWHCPWPSAERFSICPYAEQVIRGLLGSSIVGFHTQSHCNNFMDVVDRKLEARVDREQIAIVQDRRPTLVRPYPISIPWPNNWVESAPPVDECRRSVLADLGLGADVLLGVGVDRLDYTKGIEERLQAVERLLEREPSMCGRFVFVQLAAPSRTAIAAYQALDMRVEAEARRINTRFGTDRYQPIILRRSHHEPPDVFRYMRAANVCYVSSLHDGMNLVAKEFIAARTDERGVLVLSEFAGAARELTEALIVNPYDLDAAARALATAVQMTVEEQQDRMRSMRALVAEFNVYRWAGKMLVDAARVRRQERVSGRIADRTNGHEPA
ncbi:MAG: trehalose-6-phosphate synthase [Deltaproteobacteria bacterium]|nr:trehalose-6-phosphate synthase [Deltaproteobacteria bacterium]